MNMSTCIYGPVPSRRLGRSLGIDLLPAKICSYDCIYCQLGRTARTTTKRRPYRKADDVIEQIEDAFSRGVKADCITIAGSGEPTLNSDIGTVIRGIKQRTEVPVAVLTNSSLLSDRDVRQALMAADIVVPSLDAFDRELFEKINRPHNGIHFEQMLQGLIDFSHDFSGRLWLEILIMDGINASTDDAARFRPLIDRIAPTDVYINTAVRPAPEAIAKKAGQDMIDRFYQTLGISRQYDTVFAASTDDIGDDIAPAILEMAARRPVTVEDMAAGLAVPVKEIRKHIRKLLTDKRLDTVKKENFIYFRPVEPHDKA